MPPAEGSTLAAVSRSLSQIEAYCPHSTGCRNTFVHLREGELARLMVHELSHQVAHAEGDTMFNESFAAAVERIGGARWLAEQGSEAVRAVRRAGAAAQ